MRNKRLQKSQGKKRRVHKILPVKLSPHEIAFVQRVGLEPTSFVGKRRITYLRHLLFFHKTEQELGINVQ